MKFYSMALILLFSSLATAWAGVTPVSNTIPAELGSPMMHTMASHECCPSLSPKASQAAVNHAYCPYCFGDCHCDNGHCANMHLSVAMLPHSNTVVPIHHSQSIAVKSVILTSAILAQEQRPPKIL
ncbi:hypothetical protein [Thiomicrorhabdus arctica]|uniref:hypothetical protein n=1 Tax=Thiomicrorhabdus arctica TaxID=131540 RepID=UPI0012FDAC59|nr:hypothetical protein [Thiomicrorhabdus arctica]